MISQTAQGLASLGRNGDSMLVHMSPEEVGGLKQVGDTLGIKMSTNPQTGMPEAFSFSDFFTSFLPTIVGAAVGGPAGGGIMSSMTPILAGAGTGALLAAAKGDDPLMGGLTGGLGGYGGSQLGPKVSAAFGKGAGTTAESYGNLINQGAQQATSAPGVNVFSNAGAPGVKLAGATQPYSGITGPTGQVGANLSSTMPRAAIDTSGLDALSTDVLSGSDFGKLDYSLGINTAAPQSLSLSDAYGKFTKAGGTAADLALPVGGAVLAGLEPSDLGYGTGNLYEDPDKGKYRGPMGQLNLSNRFDTGLRLATGGTIQSGGIRDLYGTPDNPPAMSSGLGGFGLGRLNNLAGEQAMTQAQTLGYADGGSVSNYMTPNTPLLNQRNVFLETMTKDNPTPVNFDSYRGNITPNTQNELLLFNTIGNLKPEALDYLSEIRKKGNFGMAKGGYLDGAGDGMSDSIPATIEGKQPARLADGEFVIPADVVSHLGNGSSKAGSKRLYAMLDKVRQARTGNKKQGKEIKAEKYLPA